MRTPGWLVLFTGSPLLVHHRSARQRLEQSVRHEPSTPHTTFSDSLSGDACSKNCGNTDFCRRFAALDYVYSFHFGLLVLKNLFRSPRPLLGTLRCAHRLASCTLMHRLQTGELPLSLTCIRGTNSRLRERNRNEPKSARSQGACACAIKSSSSSAQPPVSGFRGARARYLPTTQSKQTVLDSQKQTSAAFLCTIDSMRFNIGNMNFIFNESFVTYSYTLSQALHERVLEYGSPLFKNDFTGEQFKKIKIC